MQEKRSTHHKSMQSFHSEGRTPILFIAVMPIIKSHFTTSFTFIFVDYVRIGSNSTWLDSTRLDTFDFVEPVEPVEQVETSVSSETSCALPTWRTTNDLVQV